jgi:TolB protein
MTFSGGSRARAALVALALLGSACTGTADPEPPSGPTPSPEPPASFYVGSEIAFHSDPGGADDTFVMGPDGETVLAVTSGMETIAHPTWSPDGSRLVLACCTGPDQVLLLLDGPGAEPIDLAPGIAGATAPAWSPDGTQIAFESIEERALYLVDVTEAGPGEPRPLGISGAGPSWSPDGSRIAYFAEQDGNLDIYSAAADGTDIVRLTDDPGADYSPVWSPDGASIAYVSERDGDQDVYVMAADGSGQTDVSRNGDPDESPRWSPDGSLLAYVAYLDGADPLTIGDGDAEIFLVAADGTGRTNLTRNPSWDGDPAWSPDGTQIAFTRRTDHGTIYLVNADGTDRRRLRGLPGRANDCCAAWRPTG